MKPGVLLKPLGVVGLTFLVGNLGCATPDTPQPRAKDGRYHFHLNWNSASEMPKDARIRFNESFERRVGLLQAKLQEEVIVAAVRASNGADRDTPVAELLERDRRWQLADDDSVLVELTSAECNASLRAFRSSFEGIADVFVTNLRGVKVCVTGRGVDYYKGDEDWWRAVSRTRMPSNGTLAYDGETRVVAVPVYLPVSNPSTGRFLGVARGMILGGPGLRIGAAAQAVP